VDGEDHHERQSRLMVTNMWLCPDCDSKCRTKRNDPDKVHCGYCNEDWLKPERQDN